jgi:hypothetical protein
LVFTKNKGKEGNMSKHDSGEIKHPEQPSNTEGTKPLKYVRNQITDANSTSSSGPPTSDTSASQINTEEWRIAQLNTVTKHLGIKRNVDELDPSSSDRYTKKPRTEGTHELRDKDKAPDTKQINDENQPPSSLSSAEKAKDRRVGTRLFMDEKRRVLGSINNR